MAFFDAGRVLAHAAFGHLVVHQFLQRDRAQELHHVGIERGPQVVRHALAALPEAVLLAFALGGINGLVHGCDDFGNRDQRSIA